jgi:hypothetical protein
MLKGCSSIQCLNVRTKFSKNLSVGSEVKWANTYIDSMIVFVIGFYRNDEKVMNFLNHLEICGYFSLKVQHLSCVLKFIVVISLAHTFFFQNGVFYEVI